MINSLTFLFITEKCSIEINRIFNINNNVYTKRIQK